MVLKFTKLVFLNDPLALPHAPPFLARTSQPHNRALFRVFSGCPPLSSTNLSPPSPTAANGDAERRLTTNSYTHDRTSPRHVDLPAFLEVCRRAGLLSPAAKVVRPYRGEGSAWGMRSELRGQANCGRSRGRDGRGPRGRTQETGTEENVAEPGEIFFVS